MFLIYGTVSVTKWRVQSAGLLTSAAVFAYCTYYLWSALNRWVRAPSHEKRKVRLIAPQHQRISMQNYPASSWACHISPRYSSFYKRTLLYPLFPPLNPKRLPLPLRFLLPFFSFLSCPRSEPPGECVSIGTGGNRTVNVLAFVLTLLSVAYTAWSSSTSSDSFDLGGNR